MGERCDLGNKVFLEQSPEEAGFGRSSVLYHRWGNELFFLTQLGLKPSLTPEGGFLFSLGEWCPLAWCLCSHSRRLRYEHMGLLCAQPQQVWAVAALLAGC